MTRERVELVLTLLHRMLARSRDLNNTRRMERVWGGRGECGVGGVSVR